MTNDRFDGFLKETAADYHRPPETPRDEIWARIEAVRSNRPAGAVARGGSGQWLRWGAAVAVVLVLGVGIGRVSVPDQPVVVVALAEDPTMDSALGALIYRVAATELLGSTDDFLAMFRSEASVGRADEEVGRWGRELLSRTRFMMDSPAGDDVGMRALLEDLEAVLAQIVQYTAQQDQTELDLIEEGIDGSDLMLRLRTALVVDAMPVQGAI